MSIRMSRTFRPSTLSTAFFSLAVRESFHFSISARRSWFTVTWSDLTKVWPRFMRACMEIRGTEGAQYPISPWVPPLSFFL